MTASSTSVTASLPRRRISWQTHRGLKPPATIMPSLRDEQEPPAGHHSSRKHKRLGRRLNRRGYFQDGSRRNNYMSQYFGIAKFKLDDDESWVTELTNRNYSIIIMLFNNNTPRLCLISSPRKIKSIVEITEDSQQILSDALLLPLSISETTNLYENLDPEISADDFLLFIIESLKKCLKK